MSCLCVGWMILLTSADVWQKTESLGNDSFVTVELADTKSSSGSVEISVVSSSTTKSPITVNWLAPKPDGTSDVKLANRQPGPIDQFEKKFMQRTDLRFEAKVAGKLSMGSLEIKRWNAAATESTGSVKIELPVIEFSKPAEPSASIVPPTKAADTSMSSTEKSTSPSKLPVENVVPPAADAPIWSWTNVRWLVPVGLGVLALVLLWSKPKQSAEK